MHWNTQIKETPFRKVHILPRRLRLTEFFVKRRSNRKSQQPIVDKQKKDLENKIISGVQTGLEVRWYFKSNKYYGRTDAHDKVKVFDGKGRGIVTTRRFVLNEFVVEYAGDLVTGEEAHSRERKYSESTKIGCYLYFFKHRSTQYCVDATKETGHFGRLINHSRDGNLATKVVDVQGIPKLVFFAKRDIEVGEELSYDYGDRRQEALKHHQWL